MLRKGDLIKWSGSARYLGIVMEDQNPDLPRILVYWFDCNMSSMEPIWCMAPLRKQKDA